MSNEDPLIDAYGLIVDGKLHGVMRMLRHSGYGFCYWPLIPTMWLGFLPEHWRGFAVWDIPRQKLICGSVRATN